MRTCRWWSRCHSASDQEALTGVCVSLDPSGLMGASQWAQKRASRIRQLNNTWKKHRVQFTYAVTTQQHVRLPRGRYSIYRADTDFSVLFQNETITSDANKGTASLQDEGRKKSFRLPNSSIKVLLGPTIILLQLLSVLLQHNRVDGRIRMRCAMMSVSQIQSLMK